MTTIILMNIKRNLPAGFPSLERTLVGGGLLIACSLLSCRSCSNRSLVERSRDLGREREMTFSSELWSLSLARCRLRPTRVPSSKLLSAGLLSYRWDLKKRQHLSVTYMLPRGKQGCSLAIDRMGPAPSNLCLGPIVFGRPNFKNKKVC